MNPRLFIGSIIRTWLQNNSPWIIALVYGDFWAYRQALSNKRLNSAPRLYTAYLDRFNSYIGINAKFAGVPTFPHGLSGIFISNMSKIGKNVVIFQQVTIGSNTIEGHPRSGSPVIGDNVYIGAGAKIIGNVTIGDNCRIGANCVVVKDMPANTTAVAASTRFIESDHVLENRFVSADEYIRK